MAQSDSRSVVNRKLNNLQTVDTYFMLLGFLGISVMVGGASIQFFGYDFSQHLITIIEGIGLSIASGAAIASWGLAVFTNGVGREEILEDMNLVEQIATIAIPGYWTIHTLSPTVAQAIQGSVYLQAGVMFFGLVGYTVLAAYGGDSKRFPGI